MWGKADSLMVTQSVAVQMVPYLLKENSSMQISYLLFLCADRTAQRQKE